MHVLNLVTNPRARFFAQQVRALESAGIETTTLSVPGRPPGAAGVSKTRGVSDYIRFFGPAVRRSFDGYDLVHANYGLTAPPAVVQPNLPVVISLWGTDLMGPYAWVSRICTRFADAVVVMSEEMAELLGRDCAVIPHGVDLDRFEPRATADARAELGWAEGVHHVLFPYATSREVKDFPRAERVVQRARTALDRPVELHTDPGVPHEGMPAYMNAADALLLTSRREGSPNSVKEALACNLPVVGTDVGDVRERLDGVEPSATCRSDEELVDGLVTVLEAGRRSNGRAAAREVSVARTNRRLRGLYRSLLEEGAGDDRPRSRGIVAV